MNQRQAVQHVRQPLRLLFPVDIQAPDGVVQRFVTHGHLRGQRLFIEVHQCTAK